MLTDTCDAFNTLVWHDSLLPEIHTRRRDDIDDVVAEIELRKDTSDRPPIPVTLILEDVTYIACDVDLQFKRECGDVINGASCSADSAFKTKACERLDCLPEDLKSYFHFRFYFVPPAGTIDVLATGLKWVAKNGNQTPDALDWGRIAKR